jgi:hypothetical protein
MHYAFGLCRIKLPGPPSTVLSCPESGVVCAIVTIAEARVCSTNPASLSSHLTRRLCNGRRRVVHSVPELVCFVQLRRLVWPCMQHKAAVISSSLPHRPCNKQ